MSISPQQSPGAHIRSRVLGSRLFIVGAIVMVALIALGAFRTGVKKYQINHEVAVMNDQIATLNRENERLTNFLQYLNTPNFRERQAKAELGLKNPGEAVVAVPNVRANTNTVAPAATTPSETPQTNPARWWHYFFAS